MNVIILESHPNEDGRIERHIRYLLDNFVRVYHLHFNFMDEPLMSGPFNCCGEKGYRINFESNYKNKIRTFDYLIYSLSNKIFKDCIKSLDSLNIDPTEPLIIHVHDPILLPLSSKLVKDKYRNAKIIYDRHEVYENYPKNIGINIFFNLERLHSKSVSGVAVVSDAYRKDAAQLFPNATVFTVPNFPRTNDYNSSVINSKIDSFNQDSKLNLVYIGGLNNNFDRDMDLQLKIAQKVLNHNENARFIVGGTDCPSILEKKLNDYSKQYQDRFQYLGVIPHRRKIEITEEAHIGFLLVKPSTNYWVKTSPNKVFEYLICGVVPVIRANIDFAQEISNLSLNFSRNTSEEYILGSMLQLIEDPKRIQDIMMRARDLSKKFTWESVACRYIKFYKSVLDS